MAFDDVVRGIVHAFKVRRAPILPTSFDSPRRRRRMGDVADTASSYASRLRNTKVPEVSFVQAATYVWVFISLVVALIGYASCTYVGDSGIRVVSLFLFLISPHSNFRALIPHPTEPPQHGPFFIACQLPVRLNGTEAPAKCHWRNCRFPAVGFLVPRASAPATARS